MSKIEKAKGKIEIACKTEKEFEVMTALVVYIQYWYRKKFKKHKKVNLKNLVNKAIRDLEEKGYDKI